MTAAHTTLAAPGTPPIPAPDYAMTRAFLSQIMSPEWATELRLKGATFDRGFITSGDQYGSVIAGWFDRPDDLIAQLPRIRGVSCYVTANPVRRDLLARVDGLKRCKAVTKDEDITRLRWHYVDIDPVRPADVSSTAGELAAAVEVRDEMIAHVSANLGRDLPDCMWGRSGNGAWLLIAITPLDIDGTERAIIPHIHKNIIARHKRPGVTIDPTTLNPSRVMCLPGTVKCKGRHTAERPWRLATIDGPGWLVNDFKQGGATQGRGA